MAKLVRESWEGVAIFVAPGIRRQGSGVRDQVSGIRCQGEGVRDQASGIRHRGSGVGDQASGIRRRGSGGRPKMAKLGWPSSGDVAIFAAGSPHPALSPSKKR